MTDSFDLPVSMTDSYGSEAPEASWLAALPEAIQQALHQIPEADNYLVAFSGGLDSTLLLELASRYLVASRQASVSAIHVHHGLSCHADQWQAHCEAVCRRLDVPLITKQVELDLGRQSIEGAARTARYGVFEQLASDGSVLLQGHHQNDQAETVLLRLMRGAGVAGVAGIPQRRPLNSALIYRPFLAVSRSVLSDTAYSLALDWVEDDSNENRDFDRNFIRHEIIPELEARWPRAVQRLSTSARHCRAGAELEDALAEIDLNGVCLPNDFHPALSIEALIGLSFNRQVNVVRYWLRQRRAGFPGEKKFQRIWSELIAARDDAAPLIEWSSGVIRRYRNGLFLLTREEMDTLSGFDSSQVMALPEVPGLDPDKGFQFERLIAGRRYRLLEAVRENNGPASDLRVRPPKEGERAALHFRKGGELFKPHLAQHHRPLKKWLHDCNIPPWWRSAMPLLYYNESLIAVGDRLVAADAQGVKGKKNLKVSWELAHG